MRRWNTDSVIRFRFILRPVKDVAPWGDERLVLHWFALTEGWYWIEVGDHELLRYSERTLRRWADEEGDGGVSIPYVDYYAARLWKTFSRWFPCSPNRCRRISSAS